MEKEKVIQQMKAEIKKDKEYIIEKSKSVDNHLRNARRRIIE